jgi:hypothetical protein
MIFARGALKAALWARGKKPGLYSMADVLGLATSEDRNRNEKRKRQGNERPPSRARASRPERMESEEPVHRLEGPDLTEQGVAEARGRPQAEGAGLCSTSPSPRC